MKTWMGKLLGWLSLAALFNFNVSAATHFVDASGTNPVPPYTDWSTAATNIQDAIDAAAVGDTVLATNGVYATGGRVVYGSLTNRVVINKAITVQSVNGPTMTVIKGYQVPNTMYGTSAVRCVYLTNNAVLIGFTLTNGATINQNTLELTNNGAGAWCEIGGIISNCIVTKNFGSTGGGIFGGSVWNSLISSNTAHFGGGAANASLFNCMVISNTCPSAGSDGGGIYQGMISNCIVTGNNAYQGASAVSQSIADNSVISSNSGGAFQSVLMGCIITANWAIGANGCTNYNCIIGGNLDMGVFRGVAYNCLVISNTASYCGGAYLAALYNCTVVYNSAGGPGSITAAGGITGGSAVNSIIFGNSIYGSPAPTNNYASVTLNYCDTTPLASGLDNITNEPDFLNQASGDFHLQSNSPCINSGNNSYVTNLTDLDGNPRIAGGTVDIGAYEYQTPSSILSYAWAQQYGLPTDGSADYADTDGDGMNNYAEWKAGTIPTNATSVLALQTPAPTNTAGITVTWQSVSGVTYYLQNSSQLPAFTTIASNLVGQAGTTSYTDTTATNGGPYFYRVGVQ